MHVQCLGCCGDGDDAEVPAAAVQDFVPVAAAESGFDFHLVGVDALVDSGLLQRLDDVFDRLHGLHDNHF